jgi:metallo-beta-lactamase class B
MNKKNILSLIIVLLLPLSLLAASNQNPGSGRDIFNGNETPINPPNVQENIPEPQKATIEGRGPYKLFDNLYYVGNSFLEVGVFIVKTSAGLIIIDAGSDLVAKDGTHDCAIMEDLMTKAGLKFADVKMILISHEHIDHYGCATRWQDKTQPRALLAMSRIGWDNLRSWPSRMAFGGTRPKRIDMHLFDGQQIHLGDTTIQIVATPGHSMGCMSFIVPVREGNEKHVAGIMGGSSVQKSWGEAYMYWTSVDYFKQACKEAKCDVGLNAHTPNWPAGGPKAVLARKPGDPNPLVIGVENFDSKYLESYRDKCRQMFQDLIKTGL